MASNGGAVDDCPGVVAETSFEVLLYIYDLSKELAKSFKKILKGKPLPGIWHTGLVAYGREYFYGSSGIESCRPGETILGEPDQILTLGKTELPYSVFLEYIFALGESSYRPGSYHLLEHNGNCFSQEVTTFLTGRGIPEEIRELPQEILGNKNLSSALKEYFDKLVLRAEGSKGISFGAPSTIVRGAAAEPEHALLNGHAHETETPPKPTPSKGRRNSKMASANGSAKVSTDSNSNEAASSKSNGAPRKASVDAESDAAESAPPPTEEATPHPVPDRRESTEEAPLPTFTSRRSRKYDDPPIFYPEVDGVANLRDLLGSLDGKLSGEEVTTMHEFMEYLTSEGGAWALGATHLQTIGRLLNDRTLPSDVPAQMLRVLQFAAQKEDIILLLHQDRQDHHLMSYLYKIESLPPDEQQQIAVFLCNLCSNNSSFDWLMYISEWEEDGHPCNNSKVTVRVAVHCLLSDKPDAGSALIFNLALKELFDDVATELAMAVLQFLQSELSEELTYRSLTALQRFMCISYNDVPALLKMLGPDVRKFSGISERVDKLVEEIHLKISVLA